MKKLFFVAAAAVAISFTSCKDNAPKATPDDTPQTEVVEVNYIDSLKAAIETKDASKIEQFVSDIQEKVNGAEAAKYVEQLKGVQEWLKENAETVKNVLGDKFSAVVDPVANFDLSKIATDAVEGAEAAGAEAVDAVKEGAEGAVEAAKAAGEDAVEAAKGAVEDAKDAAKGAVEDAKDAAKDAAKEAAGKAIDGAAKKLGI